MTSSLRAGECGRTHDDSPDILIGRRSGGAPWKSARPAMAPLPIEVPAGMAPGGGGGGASEPPHAACSSAAAVTKTAAAPAKSEWRGGRCMVKRRRAGGASLLAEDRQVARRSHEEEHRDRQPEIGPRRQERLARQGRRLGRHGCPL